MIAATAQPPLDKVADPTWQWVVLGLAGAAFLLACAYALRAWRRTGTPLMLVALGGGAIATLGEPMYDLVTRLYMYEHGAAILFTIGGRGIQPWAPLGYGFYIGVCVWLFFRLASDPGTTRRRFWQTVAVVMGINLAIELPGTNLGL